jgi:hypothetical protein
MSLARSSRIALSFANNAALRHNPAANRATITAYRALSTSPRRALAEPLKSFPMGNESTAKASNAPDYVNKSSFGNKGPPLGSGMASAVDEPGKDLNPYKDGPSALDKAAHLFFFTEIVRGAPFSAVRCLLILTHCGMQACGLCWSSSSDRHTPSCIRLRKGLCHHVSVENTHSVGILVERSDALVRHVTPYKQNRMSYWLLSLQALRSYLPCSGHYY